VTSALALGVICIQSHVAPAALVMLSFGACIFTMSVVMHVMAKGDHICIYTSRHECQISCLQAIKYTQENVPVPGKEGDVNMRRRVNIDRSCDLNTRRRHLSGPGQLKATWPALASAGQRHRAGQATALLPMPTSVISVILDVPMWMYWIFPLGSLMLYRKLCYMLVILGQLT
jgi:hypothetical protein